jgi:hypothetical protein
VVRVGRIRRTVMFHVATVACRGCQVPRLVCASTRAECLGRLQHLRLGPRPLPLSHEAFPGYLKPFSLLKTLFLDPIGTYRAKEGRPIWKEYSSRRQSDGRLVCI